MKKQRRKPRPAKPKPTGVDKLARATAQVKRWIDAAMKYWPLDWAIDPGNPEQVMEALMTRVDRHVATVAHPCHDCARLQREIDRLTAQAKPQTVTDPCMVSIEYTFATPADARKFSDHVTCAQFYKPHRVTTRHGREYHTSETLPLARENAK